MTSQPLSLNFFNKKVAVTEPEKSDDIPYSSNIINNTEIESNTNITDLTELTEILDIGLYINTRISDNTLKYDLLKKLWHPRTSYNFPVVSARKLKFQLSWIMRFS